MRLLAEITVRSPEGEVRVLRVTNTGAGSVELNVGPSPWEPQWEPYWPYGDRLLNLESRLFGAEPMSGVYRPTRAEIVVRNASGWLDEYDSWVWLTVRLLQGPVGRHAPYDSFEPVLEGQVVRRVADDSGVSLTLRDTSHLLLREPLRSAYQGNTTINGTEGGPELVGKPKPRVWGQCRGVEPLLVNPQLGIWQWTDPQPMTLTYLTLPPVGVQAVTEGGEPRPIEYVSAAQLTDPGAQPPAGVCWANDGQALLRPGFAVTRPLRVDTYNTSFSLDVGLAMQLAITRLAGLSYLPMPVLTGPWPLFGMILDGTAAETADQLMLAAGGWWAFGNGYGETAEIRRLEGIAFGRVHTAADGSFAAGVDTPAVIAVEPHWPVTAIGDIGWPVSPTWRVEVYYNRVWSPLQRSDFFGSVPEADRAALLQRWPDPPAVWEDPAVLAAYPESEPLRVETVLVDQADAQALADRLGAILGRRRRPRSVRVPASAGAAFMRPGSICVFPDGATGLLVSVDTTDGLVFDARVVL